MTSSGESRGPLLDLCKTMIPVIMGFLAILVATFGKFTDQSLQQHLQGTLPVWRIGELSATCGTISLACWCLVGAMEVAGSSSTRRSVTAARMGFALTA